MAKLSETGRELRSVLPCTVLPICHSFSFSLEQGIQKVGIVGTVHAGLEANANALWESHPQKWGRDLA